MPMFMDRHDVPGATAKDAADAHVSDLEMADRYSVRFLSYWFDAEAGGVFCFASAPAREHLEAVHRESHGLVPNEIIDVAEDDVLRFLGRIHDPRDHTEVTSAFRAIVFTDLEGSTAILDAVGDTAFLSLLGEHDAIVRRAVFHWRGREVKHTGDGILAAFDDVTNALRGALAIHRGFAERSAVAPDHPLRVRIGIAAGQPVDRNDDIYGSAVVLASRLCDSAEGGQTLVSDAVHEIGLSHGFRFHDAGRRTVKGFSRPTPVFALVATGDEGSGQPAAAEAGVPTQRPASAADGRGRRLRRWVSHALHRG